MNRLIPIVAIATRLPVVRHISKEDTVAKILGTTARLGLVGMTMMGLAACSMFGGSGSPNTAPPPSAPPSANAAPVAPPTAPVAQATIRDVQSALQQAGYYKGGHIDGVWGPRTQRAVTQFQRAHNLPANGKLDVPTMQALNLTGAPPSTTGTNNAATDNTGSLGTNAPPPPPPPGPENSTNAPPPPPPPGPANNPSDNGTTQPAPAR